MLKIQLNENERSELENLDIHFKRNLRNLDYIDRIDDMIAETKKIKSDFQAGKITSEQELQEKVKRLLSFVEESDKMKTQVEAEEDTLPFSKIAEKTKTLTETAIKRALKYYANHIDELVADIKENIRQSIYTASTLHMNDDSLWQENALEVINSYIEFLKFKAPECYQEIIDFIKYAFSNQEKIIKEIQAKTRDDNTSDLALYTANPLSIMFSGKATHALGQARTIGKIDNFRKNLNINGVTIVLKNFKNISSLGVGEQKIFRYIIAAFTEKNSSGTQNPQLRQRLFLSLNDYAKVTGTDISTEDRRKNFKKKIKKNLDNLKEDTTFSWTETIRGKDKSYTNISFISGYRITKDTIVVELSLSAAEYLVSLNTFIQYPRSLYLIDDRDYNSFAIGEALARHYSMNNNVIRGTEQMISVLKLLESTSFPSYETLKNKRWGWERNIKEPLEKALEHLYRCGTIKDWCYSKSKGIRLTDKEASQIISYEKFVSLYIWYELTEYPEHSERAYAIIEAKTKNIKKANHSKRSRKRG